MARPLSAEQRIHREGTLEAYHHGVERSIQVMHDRLGDQLLVDELADAAFMSRFHFSRVFTEITGASPARFLAAIRMQEAKRLLLETDRSVTDISFDIGYGSLGTFTRLFADFVGFPPIRFRQFSRAMLGLTIEDVARFIPPNPDPAPLGLALITGEIVSERPHSLVVVALFPTSIPRSRPIECKCLTVSRWFSFNHRPPHGARLFAAGMTPTATIANAIHLDPDFVDLGTTALRGTIANINLRPRQVFEPPVLVAFPLLIAESLLSKQVSKDG